MSTTETSIANLALQIIGSKSIASIDDDLKRAREIKACFSQLRDEELEKNVWWFATKRATLPADTETPAFEWSLQYSLPADYVRLVELYDVGKEYVVEGRKILTNYESPLKARYVFQETNTANFAPTFVGALAARIAARVCEPITQSDSKTELANNFYRKALSDAALADAVLIAKPPELPDGSWLDVRN